LIINIFDVSAGDFADLASTSLSGIINIELNVSTIIILTVSA